MLLSTTDSFNSSLVLPPSLVIAPERPHWLAATDEFIDKAQFLVSRDILYSEDPLADSRYLDLDFPQRVGHVDDKDSILNAGAFEKLIGNKNFWYISGDELPSGLEFLQNICEQFNTLDNLIYKQSRTLWHFTIDIKSVSRGNIHRSFFPDQEEKFHIDGGFESLEKTLKISRDTREGRQKYPINSSEVTATSLQRNYITVASVPELEDCFTEFRDAAKKFGNWDIVQFLRERHRCPEAPNNCVRLFFNGIARSI